MTDTVENSGIAVLQQCLSAKLQVVPPRDDKPDGEFVTVNRGLIIYVCFLRGITEEKIDKLGINFYKYLSVCQHTASRLLHILIITIFFSSSFYLTR